MAHSPRMGAGGLAAIAAAVVLPIASAGEAPVVHARIASLRPQALAVSPDGPTALEVDLDGVPRTLRLEPRTLRAPDFRLVVQGPGGDLQDVTPPPCTIVAGTVAGSPGSRVAGSIWDGSLRAMVSLGPEAPTYVVQPAGDLDPRAAGLARHVSFRTDDVTPHGRGCDAGTIPGFAPLPDGPEGLLLPTGGATGLVVCEIAVDADVLFFQKNGSSIAATLADIESVLAGVEMVYENDVAITYELTTVVIRTSVIDNPYGSSTPATMLCSFRDTWNTAPESFIRRDVAHLFTGRVLSGAVGVGYTGVVCNAVSTVAGCTGAADVAYSLAESKFGGATFDERVALTAHELGHNWNAGHCSGSSCHIMCATLGGCGGVGGGNLLFGPTSAAAITNFRNTRGCLPEQAAPLALPFFDDVPAASIDTTKWTWAHGASVTNVGVDEPSPPFTLQIISLGAEDHRDGEIRSNVIDLDGASSVVCSYMVQASGVEAGERLFVEYWSEAGIWIALNVITAPGIDLPIFLPYVHELPGGALHAGFRLRLRVEADEINDRWLVDDVFVGSVATPCPADLDASMDVGFPDLLAILSAWGPCVACPEDLDDDGVVAFPDLLTVLSAWGPCP